MQTEGIRNIKWLVVNINAGIVLIFLELFYWKHTGQASLFVQIRNSPTTLLAEGLFLLLPISGIALEVARYKFSVIVNLGVPLAFLFAIAFGVIHAWNRMNGEDEAGLILVALPLLIICVLYSFLYRRDLILIAAKVYRHK